jgi:hypothetical protein
MNFREMNVGGDALPPNGWPSVPKPEETPSGIADMALNAVATAHGLGLMSGRLKPGELADKIRQEVCQ